jgi:hypothetical protein
MVSPQTTQLFEQLNIPHDSCPHCNYRPSTIYTLYNYVTQQLAQQNYLGYQQYYNNKDKQ